MISQFAAVKRASILTVAKDNRNGACLSSKDYHGQQFSICRLAATAG
jgi:hypothetical protein